MVEHATLKFVGSLIAHILVWCTFCFSFSCMNMYILSTSDAFEQKYASSKLPREEEEDGLRDLVRHTMFEKGQSKRIWGELYKVIDSSDVVVQVSIQFFCPCENCSVSSTKGVLNIYTFFYLAGVGC
jgi:hypothetical protein